MRNISKSRIPVAVLAVTMLVALGWLAVTAEPGIYAAAIDAWLSERIAAALFDWFGDWNGDGFETDRPTFAYTETLLRLGAILAAAAIGVFAGAAWTNAVYRRQEEDFKRQVYEAKARLPQIETSLRNRELAVTRLKMEIVELEQKIEALNRQQSERDQHLRDRDRSINRLTSEVAMLRSLARNDERAPNDERLVILEEHSRALAEQAVDDQVVRAQIAELEESLEEARRKLASVERERDRQGRWLDVLNDQLAHAREANGRLSEGADRLDATRLRIIELEAEVARLKEALADRDRRLAASRFECANVRTALAHLKAEIERRDGVITH